MRANSETDDDVVPVKSWVAETSVWARRLIQTFAPWFVLSAGLLAVPLWQLHGLQLMPGDIGALRLNNYFWKIYGSFSPAKVRHFGI
jgi:hypothetical protein